MRIAITGAEGRVGQALQAVLQEHELLSLSHADLDITTPNSVTRLTALNPELVIHAAAMTHVDRCAEQLDMAFLVNGTGTHHIALATAQCGASMVYLSSNEVFPGTATDLYTELDLPRPINPYGESKWAGERAAAELVERLFIIRTSWVYTRGGAGFPAKIVELANEYKGLRVVADEIASPTYAPDLAEAVSRLIETETYGIYHFTNEGICSRYEFALETLRLNGLENIPVESIRLDDYARSSMPPRYSPLKNTRGAALGISLRAWTEALAECFNAAE